MKEYSLLLAPSGVQLRDVATVLHDDLDASTADIEDEIMRNPGVETALHAIEAQFADPPNMETVTMHLPRRQISELWKDSVSRCLLRLRRTKHKVRILTGHLLYYGSKRGEFYSVWDRDDLSPRSLGSVRIAPSRVVFFVDDLLDMYTRLSEQGQLFSNQQIRRYFRSKDVNMADTSIRRLSFLTMGWEVRNLMSLLAWRHMEAVMAEHLAYQLGVDFLIWPLKQLSSVIETWIQDVDSEAVYLSHPISEPRAEEREHDTWPQFTDEVNSLQKLFFDQAVLLAMPTGIDELRFQIDAVESTFTGYLDDRWPLSADEVDLLFSRPEGAPDIDYADRLLPRYWDHQQDQMELVDSDEVRREVIADAQGFFQVLEHEVGSQIASRDFLFVHHTRGMLVYRPYYAREPRSHFSGGVMAEVELLEDAVQLGEEKRVAFIHFRHDVEQFVAATESPVLESSLTNAIYERLRGEDIFVSLDTARNILQTQGDLGEVENILDRTDMGQDGVLRLLEAFPETLRRSKIFVLRSYLSGSISVRQALIGVWIVDDFEQLRDESTAIASFLQDGHPNGNGWEEDIDDLLP